MQILTPIPDTTPDRGADPRELDVSLFRRLPSNNAINVSLFLRLSTCQFSNPLRGLEYCAILELVRGTSHERFDVRIRIRAEEFTASLNRVN